MYANTIAALRERNRSRNVPAGIKSAFIDAIDIDRGFSPDRGSVDGRTAQPRGRGAERWARAKIRGRRRIAIQGIMARDSNSSNSPPAGNGHHAMS
jgi:hypothetical protein